MVVDERIWLGEVEDSLSSLWVAEGRRSSGFSLSFSIIHWDDDSATVYRLLSLV